MSSTTGGEAGRSGRFRRVVTPPLPVSDFIELQSHFEDVSRELRLVELGGGLGRDVPTRLVTLAEILARRRTWIRNEAWRQVMAARAAGAAEFRLEIDLPMPTAAITRAMIDLFDQTDRCSIDGVLLTPVLSPAARRVLDTLLEHFLSVDGAPADV